MSGAEVPRPSVAGILAVVGGAIAALGSVLDWAKASAGGFVVLARGLNRWEGKVTLIAGGILIFVGVAAMAGAGLDRLRLPAAVAGTVTIGVAIYTALTAREQVIEGAAEQISRSLGLPLAQSRDAVQRTVESGALTIGLEAGLYLVLAGGILALVAAFLAFRRPRPTPVGGESGWGTMPPIGSRTWPAGPPAGPGAPPAEPSPSRLPPAPPPMLPPPPPTEAGGGQPGTGTVPMRGEGEGGEDGS